MESLSPPLCCLKQTLSLIIFSSFSINAYHRSCSTSKPWNHPKTHVVKIDFLIPIDWTFRPRSHPQRQITARCKCHVNLLVNNARRMVLSMVMSLLSLLRPDDCLQQITSPYWESIPLRSPASLRPNPCKHQTNPLLFDEKYFPRWSSSEILRPKLFHEISDRIQRYLQLELAHRARR